MVIGSLRRRWNYTPGFQDTYRNQESALYVLDDLHDTCDEESQAERQPVEMMKCLLASFQTGRQFII